MAESGEVLKRGNNQKDGECASTLGMEAFMFLYVCVCPNHRFTTGTDTGAVKERPRWRAFQHKTQGHKDDEIHNNEVNSNTQERKY